MITVLIAFIGFVPLSQLFFMMLPARRAVIATYVVGLMFLPPTIIDLPGLPDYSKISAPSYMVFLGMMLFDLGRVLRFRPRWHDLPMLFWCATPFVSAILNDLGVWEGFSAVAENLVYWGMPYLAGRLYFNDLPSMRELAIGLFLGGLFYAPFCLYEMKQSPQFNYFVYGWIPDSWAMWRMGGWRPQVFMQDGLMLGMWMTTACFMGLMLAWSRSLRHLLGVQTWIVWGLFFIVTILCRSLYALVLLGAAMGVAAMVRVVPVRVLLLMVAMSAPCYMMIRATQLWSGKIVVQLLYEFVDADRARSLNIRLDNEDRLAQKALQQPYFGWGRYGRSRVYDAAGYDISLTDGYWMIVMGQSGLAGLVSFVITMLLPAWLFIRRFPASTWFHPAVAPALAAAVCVSISQMDNLMNARLNPLFPLMAGGLITIMPLVQAMIRTQQKPALAAIRPSRSGPPGSRTIDVPARIRQPR